MTSKINDRTAVAAETIRDQLRARFDIKPRQVSVRIHRYSMGSSINVTVKDPDLDLAPIREIAEGQQQVRRCEITHDILSGGNLFINAHYSMDALDTRRERLRAPVESAIAKSREAGDDAMRPVEGTSIKGLFAGWDGRSRQYMATTEADNHVRDSHDVDGLLHQLAHVSA